MAGTYINASWSLFLTPIDENQEGIMLMSRNSHCEKAAPESPCTSLRNQVGGIEVVVGKKANLKFLNRLTTSPKQSKRIFKSIEKESLILEYANGNRAEVADRASEIIEAVLKDEQLDVLRGGGLIVIDGLNPGECYEPRILDGSKPGEPTGKAEILGSILLEAINQIQGGSLVRVKGIHDPDNLNHYISVVAQVQGHEHKQTSGTLQDLDFHKDGAGLPLPIVDNLLLLGLEQPFFQPTLFASLAMVKDATHGSYEEKVEILKRPIFKSQPPGFVGNRSNTMGDWARPVLRSNGSELFLHPTTTVHPRIFDQALRKEAEKALAWIRRMLAQTSIGISLKPFQIAIVPNDNGAHAVWKKTVDANGKSTRQFLRAYQTHSAYIPGQRVIDTPLI